MIHGRPRPNINEAVKVVSLNRIVRTLNDFPEHVITDVGNRNVVLFTDGTNVVLVDTGGYKYPRHKTPRIAINAYDTMADYALERLLKCKAIDDDVDYVIGGAEIAIK